MSVEVIRVERVGPYGVMANNVWYGIGKRANVTPQEFEIGQSYSVDIWTADSGKKYINKVMSAGGPAVDPNLTAPPAYVAPKLVPPPPAAGGYRANDADIQERIARNTAYQKATDAVSRLLTPFISKEEDILPKLKALVEPLAGWLHDRIKNESAGA